MKIAFNVTGKERKWMADISGKALHLSVVYQKPPTYAYKIGEITVDKAGALIFDSAAIGDEQLHRILGVLHENGFERSDPHGFVISYPIDDFTPTTLENLHKMVAAKAPLIQMALGVEELPIETGDSEIAFPWFQDGIAHEEAHIDNQFIALLCKTALEKKLVSARERNFPNPRFSFRVWLISLGMVGAEYKAARKLLLAHLPGNSA